LPVAPSLAPALAAARPSRSPVGSGRILRISALSIVIALASGFVAQALTRLIGLITNLSFFGRVSSEFVSPAGNSLGWWVVLVPIGGAIIVGWMARFGSAAIRGHGIPEAMEQILFNKSRIPARLTLLKPISAAISIGTGGPFGAEGPIIATGGALGSVLGQMLETTAEERKILLSAGAGAGMAATFGSPVSAVLLAIELLLFEYRARSIIPVALACATATAVRMSFVGSAPAFAMPVLGEQSGIVLAGYIAIGALVGLASVFVTRSVYWIEDQFEKLPIHWMWWPAIGAVAVGVIGYFEPRTMGVGYDNIDHILSGTLAGRTLIVLCALKFISWSIALGSGTSGGTLAPLFTIGGALGAVLAASGAAIAPSLGLDPRMGALVGMAAMFAGASRALLASVVFAFETTRQPLGLLPLLGGCSAAFLVSRLLMRHSIMTEKIARRGSRVPSDYGADHLEQVLVRDVGLRPVVTLAADRTLASVRAWMHSHAPGSTHQGFPVIAAGGSLIGVVTRRDIFDPARGDERILRELVAHPPIVIHEDDSLRDAADLMVLEKIGRLPVVTRAAPHRLVGIITRSDLLEAHAPRLEDAHEAEQSLEPRDLYRWPAARSST
jgi:H+/Cl- antiporter ClcA/predicted transcriptional regulator